MTKGPSPDELQDMYAGGHLDFLQEPLAQFILSHQGQIFDYKIKRQDVLGQELSLDSAIRLFILHARSINFKNEIEDQIEEVNKEIWIVHERDPVPTKEQIAKNWIMNYASKWREYRVMSILFYYDRNQDYFLDLLKV